MQQLIFDLPINGVSFGQVSVNLLKEAFVRDTDCIVSAREDKLDLHTQGFSQDNEDDRKFLEWLKGKCGQITDGFDRTSNTFKLWHLNKESLYSLTDNQFLMSFYELDNPTKFELSVCNRNNKVILTSKYSRDIFKAAGADNVEYAPLGFDRHNFKVLDKKYFDDDRIVFTLCGKFEHRKNHAKILSAWAKKYGNDKKYYLNCQLWNPFLNEKQNSELVGQALRGNKYFNINFLKFLDTNKLYNDFLNSGNIVIGMSGGEGWGLPEFQSVGLGKHSVILDAHAYKDWATDKNSVLIQPNGMKSSVDGIFFHEGRPVNQGQIFDFNEDDFLSGCEEAIKRFEADKVNHEGLKIQADFSTGKSLDKILEIIN